MSHKKRPFVAGDIVSFDYNGHLAIARLVEMPNAKFGIDTHTAVVEMNLDSQQPSKLPTGTLPSEIYLSMRLADAPTRSKFFKNLLSAYDTLSVVNAKLRDENEYLDDKYHKIFIQHEEAKAQLAEAKKHKSLISRIFG